MSSLREYYRSTSRVEDAKAELRQSRQWNEECKRRLIREAIANGTVKDADGTLYEIKFNISSTRPIKIKGSKDE